MSIYLGVNIDHIIDWKAFAEQRGVTDLQELEEAYHEMNNLQVTASRTNSSNLKTDVLEWMAGPSHEEYMSMMQNQRGQARISSFFGEVADNNPFMTMDDIPEDRRQQLIGHLGTIQNPRSGMTMQERMNGPDLLMAFAHARAMARVDMSDIYGVQPMDESMEEEEEQ